MRYRPLLFAAALFAAAAKAATPFSTDVTDLWWNPDESGWGVNVIQQNNIVFATFFVYDANNRAHWYVASDMGAADNTSSTLVFTGALFETSGPYFGVSFSPAAVTRRPVGTATLRVELPNDATLTYSVDGVTVTKQIRRQTWAANDASGTYQGSRTILSASSTVCDAGTSPFGNIQLAQSNTGFSMIGTLGGSVCRFTGNYSQAGRLGASSGTFSCDNGLQGTYALSELETTLYGFFARYSGTERGCNLQGRIGGVRTTIKRMQSE